MLKLLILILIFTTIILSKNHIKSGSEKLTADEFVNFNIPKNNIKNGIKIYIWDFKEGKWNSESDKRFKIQDSVLSWKPSKSTLEMDNCRLKVMNGDDLVYISRSYFNLKINSSGKQIFQTETAVESNSFNIYPNPVKDKTINIVSERVNAEVQSIKVIDMTGLTVFDVNNIEISGNYNMHLPNITKGAYIVQITTADDVETKKIIIE